ncbi:MAG: OmpA family protein [Pseudobdellovibrionaceae bacterium]
MRLTSFPNLLENMGKTKSQTSGSWLKVFLLCSLCLFFVSCSSGPKKSYTYDSSANPSEEIQKLQSEMTKAEANQVSVFAPKSSEKARESLADAQKLQDKGKDSDKVLKELGDARGYFEQSKEVAMNAQRELSAVTDARQNALAAGAEQVRQKDLKKADKDLMDLTEEFEGKNPSVSEKKQNELIGEYQAIELSSLKDVNLGEAQSLIESARDNDAKKYAPKTLASAESKLAKAENDINQDRYNRGLILASSTIALVEAQRLAKVNDISRKTGKAGNEEMALRMVAQDEQIAALNAKASQQQAALSKGQRELSSTESQLAMDKAYQQIQSKFTPSEAAVVRQGDNVIIRMKSIHFATGSADIPSAALPTLAKVREVIMSMPVERVVVAGHTDSVGSPEINQKISEQRAESVAGYLQQGSDESQRLAGGSGEEIQIESRGYGYDHPVSPNKTKEGREQNRRVDVVITPAFGGGGQE